LIDSVKKTNVLTAVALWLATAGYMTLIYFLSSRHLNLPPLLPEYFDKLAHVLIYMPLAFLFFVSLRKSGVNKYIFLISFLLAGIYGITDELHQSFVPGRDAAAADAAADFLGASLGSFGASRVKL
jgi:VanZ family protein